MSKYSTEDIRNIAIVGHAGSGKTMLSEAMLCTAGVIKTMGTIERGTTVSDFDPLEKEQQRSLSASIMSFDENRQHINIIDTPGLADFLGDSLSVLSAVETALIVINAQSGIEMTTQRMWDRTKDMGLARAIVINHIDAEDVNLVRIVEQIRENFGTECLTLNLPQDHGKTVLDCLNNTEGNVDFSSVADAHSALVEQIVELDEDLMNQYLESGDVPAAQLEDAFKKALIENHLVPILFTNAKQQIGIKELNNFLAKLTPNPKEHNPHVFLKGEGDAAISFKPEQDTSQHILAHVFKVSIDPFVGRMGMFRVHQGCVTKESQLFINESRKAFKVGHLLSLKGKDHIEIEQAVPGDICAVAKIEEISRNVMLHDSSDEAHIHAKPTMLPSPMYGLAVQAKSRGDEGKISGALSKLTAEDPCFVADRNIETNELVLRGLGELHLRTMLARLKARYNVEVDTRPPKIAYRETISASAEGHHRHRKQTGGAGQFGEVFLRIKPLGRGEGFEFANVVFGGSIPAQYIPAVEKGIRQVLNQGVIAGYPLQDIRVEVYDGKHHPVDSKEIAFISAGKKAFQQAVQSAKPQILEPIVNVEIVVPNDNMGDVAGDLSSRRGRISGTDQRPGNNIAVLGSVPLAEMLDYQSFLKSVTGGRGSYGMDFSHYEPVPPQVQTQIVSQYKPKEEEE
ncbi:MAG: elongation factor G [Deltaproteobacteria bacterium]|nr:elongation factor G [Deltaproteobacteria bacterium]